MATAYDLYGRGASTGQAYKQLVFPLESPMMASLPSVEDKTGLVDDLSARRLRRLRALDIPMASALAPKPQVVESAAHRANERRAKRRSRAVEEGLILAGLLLLAFLTVQTSLRLAM